MIKKELPKEVIKEVKEVLETIETADFFSIDSSIILFGRQILRAYEYGIINESQKQKLKEYRAWRLEQELDKKEKILSEKLLLLEQYDERPEIFQLWYIEWRILIASIYYEVTDKKDKVKMNWWKENYLEIYKDTTPKAYAYAQKNYVLHQREAY